MPSWMEVLPPTWHNARIWKHYDPLATMPGFGLPRVARSRSRPGSRLRSRLRYPLKSENVSPRLPKDTKMTRFARLLLVGQLSARLGYINIYIYRIYIHYIHSLSLYIYIYIYIYIYYVCVYMCGHVHEMLKAHTNVAHHKQIKSKSHPPRDVQV